MTVALLDSPTMLRLCEIVEKECGVHLDLSKEYLLKNRLGPYLEKNNFLHSSDLFYKLQTDRQHLQEVVELLITNETYWFRDESLWRFFQTEIVAGFLEELKNGKKKQISIWSAASSTGQEPYSIAIIIKDEIKKRGLSEDYFKKFHIFATDISEQNLDFCRRGIYSATQIERGAQEKVQSCFTQISENSFQIKSEISQIVKFEKLNLMSAFHYSIKDFDMIFCRNVAIYFTDHIKQEVLSKFYSVLNNDGLLVLGSTETIWNNSRFVQDVRCRNLCYRKVI